MKKTLLFISALLTSAASFAQSTFAVPNGGFESWTNSTTPTSWSRIVNFESTGCIASTDANVTVDSIGSSVAGSSAIRVFTTSVLFGNARVPGISISGSNSYVKLTQALIGTSPSCIPSGAPALVAYGSFPFSGATKPASLNGYVKYKTGATNSGSIGIILFGNGGDTIGTYIASPVPTNTLNAYAYAVAPSSSYSAFTMPITHLSSASVDSIRIILGTSIPSDAATANAGDTLFVDGLSLTLQAPPDTTPESIETLSSSTFNVSQNAPNPFDGTTTITFNATAAANVTFTVLDLLGRVVREQTINANAGTNTISFSAGSSAPGTYFYTISDGTNTVTKRMVISE